MKTRLSIEQFLKESPKVNAKRRDSWCYLDKSEIYECEEIFDKPLLEFETDEILYLFSKLRLKGDRPIIEPSTIKLLRYAYKAFFEWNNNKIFSSKELSQKEVSDYLQEIHGDNLVLYLPEQFETICATMRNLDTSGYHEGILRSFYEGVRSIREFIIFKEEDVNWEENVIEAAHRDFYFTDQLKQCYKEVVMMNHFYRVGKKGKTVYIESVAGSLYKFPKNNTKSNITKEERINRIKETFRNRFKYIEEHTKKKVNVNILYDSGVLKLLIDGCSGNIQEAFRLIISDKSPKNDTARINEIIKCKGCKYNGKTIRLMFRPYILQLLK